MDVQEQSWYLKEINCPVCNAGGYKVLGIRGNHEYYGADQTVTPHICTNVVQCSVCNFIYTNPMIYGMEHLENSHYNNPDEYQKDEKGSIQAMFGRRLGYISVFKKEKKLLDIGAGKGEFLNVAKKSGWEVSGIEPSGEFCKYAKDHFDIDISEGFLANNSFPLNSFDLVTLNHVLEHVDQPHELLHLISGYLKNDGVLFIEVPNSDSTLLRLADFFFRMKGLKWSSRLSPLHPPFHKYGYSEKSLQYLLNKNHYKVLSVKTYPEGDRSSSYKNKSLFLKFKTLVSGVIDLFGNRELISVIAKPEEK